jgi:hypothetical protein
MDDDIDWDEESLPLGEGTEDDPVVYRTIGSSFGCTISGQPLRIASEGDGPVSSSGTRLTN